jgi:hypothetical protein
MAYEYFQLTTLIRMTAITYQLSDSSIPYISEKSVLPVLQISI